MAANTCWTAAAASGGVRLGRVVGEALHVAGQSADVGDQQGGAQVDSRPPQRVGGVVDAAGLVAGDHLRGRGDAGVRGNADAGVGHVDDDRNAGLAGRAFRAEPVGHGHQPNG